MILLLSACISAESAPVATGAPPPYGFWGLNGYVTADGLSDVSDRFHASILQTSSTDPAYVVEDLLPMARAAGMAVTLRLTGSHSLYTSNGDFDLDAWKASLDRWADADLAPFIADGTLAGHMILDDIRNFDGRDPTGEDLDEMARYSKEMLPGLMTYVREEATELPTPAGGRYGSLDASVNQYRAVEGGVRGYARREAARAARLGLGVINGLNIANGGDGSSGQPGWGEGKWAMSAAEIRRYGNALADVPTMGMFLNWEYDGEEPWPDGTLGSAYFDQPELQSALAAVGDRVARHPHVNLLRELPTKN